MWLLYLVIVGFVGAVLSLVIQYNLSAQSPAAQSNKTNETYTAPKGSMDLTTARNVLGITSDARRREILTAHRRLIRHMHPDRGGSEYLAMQINQAKDTLLQAHKSARS